MSRTMRADEMRGMNIVIFEAGVAGGLSSLFVFKELVDRVRAIYGSATIQELCDVMAGSGTGALIACMLGLLNMSVEQAIVSYARLVERVFSDKKMLSMSGSGAYKASVLEEELKNIVREATGDQDTRMMRGDTTRDGCDVMVFAMSEFSLSAATPRIFRSYQGQSNQMPDCPVWQVVRASMAHPELFKSIAIGDGISGESLIGADAGCSNPTRHVLTEVSAMYPNRHVSSIVCIGAGHTRTIQIPRSNPLHRLMPTNVLVAMKEVATDSERVAQEMAAQFDATAKAYWRLSVDQGMQGVRVSQWQRRGEVMAHTRSYMQQGDTTRHMGETAKAMWERKETLSVAHIGGRAQQPTIQATTGVKRCPAPSSVFTGCEHHVSQVVMCLLGPAKERRVCVVHGLGGSGKTQIALKAVERTMNHWANVAYVDATSKETLETTLKGFAISKNAGETYEDAIRWLETSTEPWLLVLDNADDCDMRISTYIPTGTSGSVLITTRLLGLALLGQGPKSDCAVGMMQKADAVELLTRQARRQDEELSREEEEASLALVEDLGFLALAVVHAGAYICRSKLSIAKYRRICQENTQMALERYSKLPTNLEQYEKTVYTTWMMSYERLSSSAQQFLWFTAYLHNNGIKEDIFQRAASRLNYNPSIPDDDRGEAAWAYVKNYLRAFLNSGGNWDSSVFSAIMDELLSYSLIDYDRLNEVYTAHVLVQDWSRTVVPHSPSEALINSSHLLALSIDFSGDTESHAYRRGLVLNVSKILGSSKAVDANDAIFLAMVYEENGQWKEEEKLLNHVLKAQQHTYGENHPDTLVRMAALAVNYRNQGRWEEAEAMQVKQLDASKTVHGDNHTETLTCMSSLALTYSRQGRWDEAEALEVKVLDACRERLGEHHPDTLSSMSNLASTFLSQGRWDEAEALQVKVLDARRERLGEHHPNTLVSMNNLASTYWRQGRWGEAEALQVKVLDARRERLGEHHPHTLTSMGNLASTYSSQGRWDEAEALNVKVVDACREQLGEHHPHTLTSMSNLASTYQSQGRWDEAEALEVKVLDARRERQGEHHPDTLSSMNNLASTYCSQGRWDEAEALQVKELDACRERLGEHHPDTLTSMYNLARTYQCQKRWDKSDTLLVQTVAACKHVYGEQHREVLDALRALSKTYKALGRTRKNELRAIKKEIKRVEEALGG